MKHFDLTPSGNPATGSVFFESRRGQRPVLRARYADLACPGCGRLDEYAAVARGIDPSVSLPLKKDFGWNADLLLVAGPGFRRAYTDAGLTGLRFVPLASGDTAVILPEVVVPTDPGRSKMRFIGPPCERCGRYRESLHLPALESMEVPTDDAVVFSSALRPEKSGVRMSKILVSERALGDLQRARLSGIDWTCTRNSY